MEASISLRQDIISWRQSITTGKTFRDKVVVRQFTWANHKILAGADPELDSANRENVSQMNNEAEERKLHRMAKVHDFLEMWQGSQIYVLPRRNHTLKTSRWPPWDTFQLRKRLSKHPGHSFNMMVQQHSNCQKDLVCYHLCLQKTSLEDELKC